jgi:hypothetical protein
MRQSRGVLATILIQLVGFAGFAAEPFGEIRVKPRVSEPISYASGGVGADARQTLLPEVRDYGLKLTFAGMPQREFLAEVEVRIVDERGRELISTRSKGPMLFAKLPRGQYRVVATFRGQTQEKTATVDTGKQTELNFYWQT